MSEERVMRIPAEVDRVGEVQAFVDALLEAEGCTMKTQIKIDIAVEEMFVNIAHYAYPDGPGEAEISAGVKDGSLWVTFRDWGIPFDPVSRQDPDTTLSADDRKIGGLGIFMVKKSMDSMRYAYQDGQNVLTITKQIHSA